MDELIGFKFSYSTMKDKDSANAKLLYSVAMGTHDKRAGIQIIANFPIVTKWYELIAKHNNLDVFDPLVAKAYWIGNSLLDKSYDFSEINNFLEKKYSIRNGVPENSIPHHNLHVNNFGIISDSFASDKKVKSCVVKPVEYKDFTGLAISLIDNEKQIVSNPFDFEIKQGDIGAVHRNTLCALLDEDALYNLRKYGFEKQQ